MSQQQAKAGGPGESIYSQKTFLELYKSISDACKEVIPLEKKVFPVLDEYEKMKQQGRISKFELHLNPNLRDLIKNIDRLNMLYSELDKASEGIRELRKTSLNSQDEVSAITETKTYLSIEQMRAHSRMMSSPTESERMIHADEMEGLALADKIIGEHTSEMREEIKKMKEELSKKKLL